MQRYRIPSADELPAIKKELRTKFGYSEETIDSFSPRSLLHNLEWRREEHKHSQAVRKQRIARFKKDICVGKSARPDLVRRIEKLISLSRARSVKCTIDEFRCAANNIIARLSDEHLASLVEQGLDKGVDLYTLFEVILHVEEWEDEDGDDPDDDPDDFRYSNIRPGVLLTKAAKRKWLSGKIDGEGQPSREKVDVIVASGILRPVIVDLNADFCVEGRHRLSASLRSGQPLPVVYLS